MRLWPGKRPGITIDSDRLGANLRAIFEQIARIRGEQTWTVEIAAKHAAGRKLMAAMLVGGSVLIGMRDANDASEGVPGRCDFGSESK